LSPDEQQVSAVVYEFVHQGECESSGRDSPNWMILPNQPSAISRLVTNIAVLRPVVKNNRLDCLSSGETDYFIEKYREREAGCFCKFITDWELTG
jgi:hypothetical protein